VTDTERAVIARMVKELRSAADELAELIVTREQDRVAAAYLASPRAPGLFAELLAELPVTPDGGRSGSWRDLPGYGRSRGVAASWITRKLGGWDNWPVIWSGPRMDTITITPETVTRLEELAREDDGARSTGDRELALTSPGTSP
jgi:hypothetical protein